MKKLLIFSLVFLSSSYVLADPAVGRVRISNDSSIPIIVDYSICNSGSTVMNDGCVQQPSLNMVEKSYQDFKFDPNVYAQTYTITDIKDLNNNIIGGPYNGGCNANSMNVNPSNSILMFK